MSLSLFFLDWLCWTNSCLSNWACADLYLYDCAELNHPCLCLSLFLRLCWAYPCLFWYLLVWLCWAYPCLCLSLFFMTVLSLPGFLLVFISSCTVYCVSLSLLVLISITAWHSLTGLVLINFLLDQLCWIHPFHMLNVNGYHKSMLDWLCWER
jgi:hypothetical protein